MPWRENSICWRVTAVPSSLMRRVPLNRLLQGKPGSVWSGNDQMAWHPAPGVVGVSLARRLTAESIVPLSSIVHSVTRERPGLDTFVLDAGRVEADGCDEAALTAIERFVVEPLCSQGKLRDLKVVASRGLGQTALVGAVALAKPRAWAVYPQLDAVLQLLSGKAHPPSWADELLSTLNSELAPLGIVSRVRAELGENPGRSLDDVASRLNMPARSLQRALAEAATTFANERVDLRLELAASRLSKTPEKVKSIASEVGYQSLPHFVMMFRARYGLSPSAFRARRQQWSVEA